MAIHVSCGRRCPVVVKHFPLTPVAALIPSHLPHYYVTSRCVRALVRSFVRSGSAVVHVCWGVVCSFVTPYSSRRSLVDVLL